MQRDALYGCRVATLSGGHTVSFNLDPNQISVVQAALHHLAGTPSEVSSVFGSPWPHPHDYNVYNLDGGTTVPFVPPNTDAFVLDSVNGSAGSIFVGSSARTSLWVGNQGNDTFIINSPFANAPGSARGADDDAKQGAQNFGIGDGDHDRDRDHARGHPQNRDHDRDQDHDGGHPDHRDGDQFARGQTIIAGDGNNSIFFNTAPHSDANLVDVGNGNDTITFLGDGTVHAGSGNSAIDFADNGAVSVGAGSDTIIFAGNVSIVADGAATVIGSDPPGGAPEHATIHGGTGNFVFRRGDGNDSVTAGSGAATLTAGQGNDTFHAGASANALLDARGTSGHDAL